MSNSSGSMFENWSPTVQQFEQEELSDLIGELNLSEEAAEILASRLKEKKLP